MKKGAALINTARAEVIDEPSLLKMFAERPDFKYGADVAPLCAAEIAEKYAGRFVFHRQEDGGADRGSQRQLRARRRAPDRGLPGKGRQDVPGQQVSAP